MRGEDLVRERYDASCRRLVGAVAVVAVAVALTVGLTATRQRGPQPAAPTPTSSQAPSQAPSQSPSPGASIDAATIVRLGTVQGAAFDSHGDQLTVWYYRKHGGQLAWAVRGPGRSFEGLITTMADAPALGSTTDGFVLLGGRHIGDGIVVHPDGTTTPIRRIPATPSTPASSCSTSAGTRSSSKQPQAPRTAGATLFVFDGEHLWRSTDSSWTHFAQLPELPRPSTLVTLIAAGDRVIARDDSPGLADLYALDDAGHVTAVTLSR
jgi:hypothetical protein